MSDISGLNYIHVQGFFNHAVREGYRGAIVANVDDTLWLSDGGETKRQQGVKV